MDHAPTILALLTLAGCGGEPRESEAHARFAEYRACLTGGPLDEGETLTERLRDIELAFPEPPSDWPERCSELSGRAYRASTDHPIIRRALSARTSPRAADADAAWARADRAVTSEAPSTITRPPPPVRPLDDALPSLGESQFGGHRVKLPPTSGAPARATIMDGRRLVGCEVEEATRQARCATLDSASELGSITALDAEPGAPFLVDSAEGVFLQTDEALQRVGSHGPGRGHVATDGTAYLVQDVGGEKVLVVHGETRAQMPIPGAGFGYHRTQIRDGRLLWTRAIEGGHELVAAPLSPDGPRDAQVLGALPAPLRIGGACRGPWGRATAAWDQPDHDLTEETLRTVRVFIERDDEVAVLDAQMVKPRSRTNLLMFRLHGAAPTVTCTDEAAILHVNSGGVLRWLRCTSRGCSEHELPLEHAGTQAAFIEDQLLLARRDRGVRVRFGPPESVATLPERLIVRPRRAHSMVLQSTGRSAVLWLFDDEHMRAVHVDADGTPTPVRGG